MVTNKHWCRKAFSKEKGQIHYGRIPTGFKPQRSRVGPVTEDITDNWKNCIDTSDWLTCVTPHVDLQTTGLVVNFPAARVRARVVATFPEVGAIVGEQGAKGDEGLFTACRTQKKKESVVTHQSLLHLVCVSIVRTTWKFTLVGSLRRKMNSLVTGESRGAAEPLAADLADKGAVLLVHFDVSL